jgi:hypothetical protein
MFQQLSQAAAGSLLDTAVPVLHSCQQTGKDGLKQGLQQQQQQPGGSMGGTPVRVRGGGGDVVGPPQLCSRCFPLVMLSPVDEQDEHSDS